MCFEPWQTRLSVGVAFRKNLSLAILIDKAGLSLKQIESKLFTPNRLYLVRVKSKFIQTMGYSVEVSINKSACVAKILKHSSPAEPAEADSEESKDLFEFLTSLDDMKKVILDETSEGGEKRSAKRDSSDEEDEKRRLKFVQTFDMLYPEEALYQMENVSVRAS